MLIDKKQKNSIVWVARFIDCKHPEFVVRLAERLKQDGYDCHIKMVGSGELIDEVERYRIEKNLQSQIEITGAVSLEQVREYMEKAEIHIFTSDRNEGWGAVLNEAMNSACACVCSNVIGASGFLIKEGVNGNLYQDGNFEEFYQKVRALIDKAGTRKMLAFNAYNTMIKEWNAANAVGKFLKLCNNYFDKGVMEFLFSDGVLSKAE